MKAAFNRNSLVRSALIVTGATYVTYVSGLIINTLIARGLGPDDFGRYSYVVWLSGIVVIFCTNGLTTTGIKFVAENLGRDDDHGASRVYWLLRRYFRASLAIVAVGMLVAAPFVRPAGWNGGLWFFVFLVLASGLSKSVYLLHSSVAKGYGNFGIEASTTNVLGMVGLVATALLVVTQQPLATYLLLFVLLGFGHAFLTLTLIRRTPIRPVPQKVDPDILRRLNVHLGWTIVMVLLGTVSNRTIETFLLNKMVGADAVGFFLIAATLTRGGTDLLVNGLTAVLIPVMAHSYGRGGADHVGPILSNAVRYFLFFGLLLAGVGVLCADLAIGLMYGPKYAPVVGVFKAMVVIAGLTLTEGAFNALLTTTDHQRLRVILTASAVVVSGALAFALIPGFGLAGAVMGHVASRVVMFLAIVLASSRTMRVRLPWREIGRQFASAAVAAVVAAMVLYSHDGAWMGLVAATAYGLVLVGCSFVFRVWRAQDLALLGGLAERYPKVGVLVRWIGSR